MYFKSPTAHHLKNPWDPDTYLFSNSLVSQSQYNYTESENTEQQMRQSSGTLPNASSWATFLASGNAALSSLSQGRAVQLSSTRADRHDHICESVCSHGSLHDTLSCAQRFDEGNATETPDTQTYVFTELDVLACTHSHGIVHHQDEYLSRCEDAMPPLSNPGYRIGTTANFLSSQVSSFFDGVPSRLDTAPVDGPSDMSKSFPSKLDIRIEEPKPYTAFCPLQRIVKDNPTLYAPCGEQFSVSTEDKSDSPFHQHAHKHHDVPEIAQSQNTRKVRENRPAEDPKRAPPNAANAEWECTVAGCRCKGQGKLKHGRCDRRLTDHPAHVDDPLTHIYECHFEFEWGCHLCSLKYDRKRSLKRHLNKKHQNQIKSSVRRVRPVQRAPASCDRRIEFVAGPSAMGQPEAFLLTGTAGPSATCLHCTCELCGRLFVSSEDLSDHLLRFECSPSGSGL